MCAWGLQSFGSNCSADGPSPYPPRTQTKVSPSLIATSPSMQVVARSLRALAPFRTAVFLLGERGAGRETAARALHALGVGEANEAAFIRVGREGDGSLSQVLDGSSAGQPSRTLYVHEPRTLSRSDVGALRRALDPALASPHLPRLVFGSRATPRELAGLGVLDAAIASRLEDALVPLPPLGRRRGELPALVAHFWREAVPETRGRDHDSVERTRLLDELRTHPPANISELRRAVRRRAWALRQAPDAVAKGTSADPSEAPANRLAAAAGAPSTSRGIRLNFTSERTYRELRGEVDAAFEAELVEWLLSRHEGNISAAARAVKMDRKFLHRLIRRVRERERTSDEPSTDPTD